MVNKFKRQQQQIKAQKGLRMYANPPAEEEDDRRGGAEQEEEEFLPQVRDVCVCLCGWSGGSDYTSESTQRVPSTHSTRLIRSRPKQPTAGPAV